MSKLKLYKFALVVAGGILISATSGHISASYAAPATAGMHLKHIPDSNVVEVQRRRWVARRNNQWVGPAIVLGIFGAIAGASAHQQYYSPQYGYYQQPYGQPYGYYYQQPRRRCFVQTDPVMLRGYYTWC